MAQVALDLELHVLRRVAVAPAHDLALDGAAQLAAELLVHDVVAQVGDVADHAGDAQAALGHHAVRVEVAAVEVRVGHDGAPRDLVEGDVLGREIGCARHHDGMAHALRVLQRPRQRLHAAQAAAHDGGQRADAQCIEQTGLGVDPVLHGDDGEVGAIDAAGRRIDVHGSGRAEARAQVVHADDEEAVGVQRLARPDHVVPPTLGLRLARVDTGQVVGGIERMAHQHRVGAVGVERAVGLVGQHVVAQRRAAAQGQRTGERHRLGNDLEGRHGRRRRWWVDRRSAGHQ